MAYFPKTPLKQKLSLCLHKNGDKKKKKQLIYCSISVLTCFTKLQER